MSAFFPTSGATVNIDVSNTSQNVKLVNDGAKLQVRVMNNGSATAWIGHGDSSAAAAVASGMPFGPGTERVITLQSTPGAPLYVAAIAAASMGKIYFTPGSGGI